MKKTSLLFITIGILCSAICTAQSIDKESIPGHYIFSTLLFDDPVDFDKNGIASREFEAEADACTLDIQYDLNADGTGKYFVGQRKKDCKIKQEKAIKWRVKIAKVKQKGKETGKIEEVTKTFLVISDDDGFDPTPYEIVEQSKKRIILRGEFRDGSDSTSPGVLELKKKK
jgi:hypothetical protein